MRRRALLILGGMLLLIPGALAQSKSAAGDPVTGNWGDDGQTMLELKFDGKSTVTGTAIWRHSDSEPQRTVIKTGTFNPKTGLLRLEGDGPKRPDGRVAAYVIEGKVSEGVISGTYKVGEDSGQFTFKKQ